MTPKTYFEYVGVPYSLDTTTLKIFFFSKTPFMTYGYISSQNFIENLKFREFSITSEWVLIQPMWAKADEILPVIFDDK